MHDFLVHKKGDHVGVAVREIKAGSTVKGHLMDTEEYISVQAMEDVPYGHKIALVDLPEGKEVIEYGVRVGKMSRSAKKGVWIHVHNIKSARWGA